MNALQAMRETMTLADQRGMPMVTTPELSFPHLRSMLERAEGGEFSYGKLCRWLGWMQAAVVASGVATLEDMKQINLRNRDDEAT